MFISECKSYPQLAPFLKSYPQPSATRRSIKNTGILEYLNIYNILVLFFYIKNKEKRPF
jgi:hypothetical protein